jgi:hypothetical protein
MLRTKVVEKIKTHFMFNNVLAEGHALYEIMWKKCCRAGETTDNTVKRRMRVACLTCKATNTHTEYVVLILHGNSDYAIPPQCYVTRSLVVFGEVTLKAGRALWLVESSLQR